MSIGSNAARLSGADGAPVLAGLNTLYGVAFSGERGVEVIEISADDGATWQQAGWVGPDLGSNAWRTFQFAVNLPVGIRLREFVSQGEGGRLRRPCRVH